MTPPLYLLDTNILLHLIRGKATGAYIDSTYQLQKQPHTPLICIVTHGEIWTLARENG
jgi:tRNA(fMet)-specific endonuclease VapC